MPHCLKTLLSVTDPFVIYRDKTVNQRKLAALLRRIYAVWKSEQGYTEQPYSKA